MATTEHLARFAVETQFPELPEAALREVKKGMLDSIGTALESTARPVGRIVAGFTEDMGGAEAARLIGSGLKTSAPNAAFANSILTHGGDYDDLGPFGNPSSILAPTVLSVGEQRHLSGREVVEAFVVGFEVGARLGQNIGGDHDRQGWDITATAGVMAATAAASRLLGLSVEQTQNALGIATSSASGVRANFGYMAKPYHVGDAARAGVVSALLAKRDFTGNPGAIEDRFGFFSVFGDQQASLAGVISDLGLSLAITSGIGIKPWPCSAGTHAAITCLEEMWAEHPVNSEDVASVEVTVGQDPLNITPHIQAPQTGLNGRFSLWYVIAAFILDGKVDLNSFTDRRVQRPEAQDLLKRVLVHQHPDTLAKPARAIEDGRGTDITLNLRDGTQLTHKVASQRHLHGEEILNKFRDNARLAGINTNQIERCIHQVEGLETLADITTLMDAAVAEVQIEID